MECPICDELNEEDYCEHFVLLYDCTFPYATGASSCALDVSSNRVDTQHLDQLVEAVGLTLPGVIGGIPSEMRSTLRPGVVRLLEIIAEFTEIEDEEVHTDQYVDLRAYREFLEACIAGSPAEVEGTYFEDNIPGASSTYRAWWSTDAEAAARYLEGQINEDVSALRSIEPSPDQR
jgi:hypothetical protein